MSIVSAPVSVGKRIIPVKCVMSDGVTSLACKVSRVQRHIANAAKIWQGSQQEYESWANASIVRALESFADRVACVPKAEPEPTQDEALARHLGEPIYRIPRTEG